MLRLVCLLPLVLVIGCTSRPLQDTRPKVIASFSVLDDFVRRVAGDTVQLTTLVGADGDAHTFEPTPREMQTIGEAKLIFEVGAQFETKWLDKACTASRSSAKRVVVSSNIKLMAGGGDEPGQSQEHDPHIWHEVNNAIAMVQQVRDGLCELMPDNAEQFCQNAATYIAELHALDEWIVSTVNAIPPDQRKLVTSHDTFGYFAHRYGFRVLGSVLPSFSTEAADPTAAEFAELVTTVKKQNVRAIFCEASHNAKLVNRLAEASGVRVAPPLYTDALGPKGSPGETYIGMMKHNVSTIVKALQP